MVKWFVNKGDNEWLERYMDIVKYVEWYNSVNYDVCGQLWYLEYGSKDVERDEYVNRRLWIREYGSLDGYND